MRSNDNCQKIKLLILYEMLRQETDEEHPMRTNDICQRLEQKRISCDRRTLAEDIQTLNEFGFEVHSRRVGKGKGYYIEDRSFSLPELKVLIDAVQASNTITENKSDALIDKITDLGGSHRSALLKRNSVKFNMNMNTGSRNIRSMTATVSGGILISATRYGKRMILSSDRGITERFSRHTRSS